MSIPGDMEVSIVPIMDKCDADVEVIRMSDKLPVCCTDNGLACIEFTCDVVDALCNFELCDVIKVAVFAMSIAAELLVKILSFLARDWLEKVELL